MSTSVLPSLPGLGFPWTRAPIYKTRTQANISGKEVRIADWSYPRYQWVLQYNALRQSASPSFTEFSQLEGFFETLLGGWDSFLYTDPDDNSVTTQALANGDGATTVFQLVRTFGGVTIPVLAPNVVTSVWVNGSLKTVTTDYTISNWGTAVPGCITFTVPPGAGQAVTTTFTYYFPCRFDDDTLTFSKFLSTVYELKKLSFTSIK